MILAIDTSGAIAVALVEPGPDGAAVATAQEFAPRAHAELLAGLIRGVLADAGAERGDVTGVVAGTGPAPFTGLRVGLVSARTLAYAWGVPLAGACSLDAVGAKHGGDCTVVTDARRREVYWAQYSGGERVDGPGVAPPGAIAVRGDVLGRGVGLYPDVFPTGTEADPEPAWLARVVARRRAAGVEDFPVEPLYLRKPDVHGQP